MLSSPVTQSSGSLAAFWGACGWSDMALPVGELLPSPTGMFRFCSVRSGGDEFQVERFGDREMADLAAGDVEAVGEMGIGLHRRFGAVIGEPQHEGQGRVVER